MKKTILFLFKGECFQMPPFLTILDSLCDNYYLKIINTESKDNRTKLKELYAGKTVDFLGNCEPDISMKLISRIRRRLNRIFDIRSKFYHQAVRYINDTSYDLLWVIHEDTICEFRNYLSGKKYITSIYELRDDRPDMIKRMYNPLREAKEVIVAEYNRGCIFRVWFKLDKTPTVVPNKPFNHPLRRCIENDYTSLLNNKNIILYQGGINEQRKLDVICRAVSKIEGWTLVLMGQRSTYRDKLQREYPNIVCIDFVAPPKHLEITSYAKIGIVKYDYTYLNHAYCAPNKIWEYTGFGIPILGNDLPGLEYTVGKYKAGEFINIDDEKEVERAIKRISDNYDEYSTNALAFYNSLNIKEVILKIAQRNTI